MAAHAVLNTLHITRVQSFLWFMSTDPALNSVRKPGECNTTLSRSASPLATIPCHLEGELIDSVLAVLARGSPFEPRSKAMGCARTSFRRPSTGRRSCAFPVQSIDAEDLYVYLYANIRPCTHYI